MSRREVTFFGVFGFDFLKQIDKLGQDSTVRRLQNTNHVQLITQPIGGDFPNRKSIRIDIATIEQEYEEYPLKQFMNDRKFQRIEQVATDLTNIFSGAVQEERPYRSIFIDMDPLPWVRDTKITNDYLKSVDASGQVMEITPVYNYYAGAYQNAIATPFIDERLLPSIYDNEICRILNESDNDNFLGSELSLNSARSRCGDLLPQTPEDWDDFGRLLEQNPANQNMSANVTLFPQSEIREILDLHKKKNLYPMYVDITFPTAPTGPFMKAMGQAKLSTTLFNEIVRRGSFSHITVGSSNTLHRVDAESIENRRELINSIFPDGYNRESAVEVQDIEEIVQNIVQQARSGINEDAGNIDLMFLRGSERNLNQERGGCMSLLDRVYLKAVTDRIESIKERSDKPDLIDRAFNNRDIHRKKITGPAAQDLREKFGQEVIAYSIEKSNQRMGLLSTHIFPNSGDLNVLKFVDTQVKYNEEYQYEVFAHVLTTGEEGRISLRSIDPGSFEIETKSRKRLVLAKVPIASNRLTGPTYRPTQASQETRPINGSFFPIVKILDRPPIAPNFTFIPYKGVKNKMLIKLERQTDELTGQRTVPYIPILEGDTERFEERAVHQRIENFDLPQGHVEFKAEGEDTVAVQIFRTTEEPEYTIDPEEGTITDVKKEAYLNFADNLYREVTVEEGMAFTDTLIPNTKYYYTFRSVDINGNFSNPTAIMQVEIVETEGVTYPLIKEYVPQRTEPNKQDSRKMTRFLQIKPSFLASEPLPNDEQTLVVGEQIDDTVFGKHYKIRITSLDTGRQFDVNCKFDKVVLTEEE